MPNIKSAKKRLRQNATRAAINLPVATRVKTSRRAFLEAVASGDQEASKKAYSAFCTSLDKAATRGVIEKNNAVRRKRRAAERLRTLTSTPAS